MKSDTGHKQQFGRLRTLSEAMLRIALSLLLVLTTLSLLIGIGKSAVEVVRSLHQPLDTILQNVLLDAVFILALVEISLTVLGYLRDGRVNVRYIVDTVLIIMLNEIVSMWFKHPSLQNAIALSVIVATLAGVRVALTRLSPSSRE